MFPTKRRKLNHLVGAVLVFIKFWHSLQSNSCSDVNVNLVLGTLK